ncbi:hypothetical protein L226DRAFT_538926 [Lentinus tigrinus ALCF2SS1-7]|uniref:Uncharacterized protein n=1 Tax=Lentinus tigrinus ALCF2SS1-6 TaxID=1328759 RepID=A0A5C2S3C0_9APHY|nr:hypothetical protein L227DRAFT_655235 [Lentinus tigrinus ALCF2SS1-6]RPD70459.1 hypothetical protein L226DRAFT_538926 [Lentinus tigrinus ALCF2SS1-7]
MWLLSTDRAELHHFTSPESVPGGYAILSHVWDGEEQSFQQTQEYKNQCQSTGQNPRDLSTEKVKESCILAEEHGYNWIWNDTCCIDKTSSAELSEAINSMFRYYSLADVCYAYLKDVPPRSPLVEEEDVETCFRLSQWHERGWTLQELIAPPYVLFLNQAWDIIGSKTDHAHTLEGITKVPAAVLRHERGLEDVSVAARMSWVANRKTTRLEDEAYCLLGIFSINMPTLYGEGRRAFQRLQEEIMKNYPDTTLFAWGTPWVYSTEASWIAGQMARNHLHSDDSYLLAPAPSAFASSGGIVHRMPTVTNTEKPKHRSSSNLSLVSLSRSYSQDHIGIPTFAITPHGIRARIPVVERLGYIVGVFSWFKDQTQFGLLLVPSPDSFDPRVPRYNIGVMNTDGPHRLISLGDNVNGFELFGKGVTVQWKEVYLAHRAQPGMEPQVITRSARILMGFSMYAPFRFSQANLAEFITQHGNLRVVCRSNPVGWTGAEPMEIPFVIRAGGRPQAAFRLRLGRCTKESLPTPHSPESQAAEIPPGGWHWAKIDLPGPGAPTEVGMHNCSADHIHGWPKMTTTLGIPDDADVLIYRGGRPVADGIILAISPYALKPQDTFVINLFWRRPPKDMPAPPRDT